MAFRPSRVGRAPVPPELKVMISKSGMTGFVASGLAGYGAAAAQRGIPEGGGAFGGDAFGHGLVQATHHQVRQQVADDVADGDGVGAGGVQDAALGDFHAER